MTVKRYATSYSAESDTSLHLSLIAQTSTPHTSSSAFYSMAEIVGIAAGIGSILKALNSASVFLQNISSASREAQEVASQVHATEAIPRSLLHRPQEFHDIWGESTKLVLRNVKATNEPLHEKLSSKDGKARLSFWSKMKWPPQREESIVLQHMQAYMHMLSIVQITFKQ
jgi:hypothetical protein